MWFCKECADKFKFEWSDTYAPGFMACGICGKNDTCGYQNDEDILKMGFESSTDIKDPWYADPIYKMYDGEYADLAKLLYVGSVYCNANSLSVRFTYYLRGNKNGTSEQRRKMVNNEIITIPSAKGTETFIKLSDGGQIAQKELNNDYCFNHSKIFAVQNFEVERQKLITAWKQYRKAMYNKG